MESHLDFTGKATETRTKHKRTSSVPELTTQEIFTYAPQGQMISHIHQVGSQAPQQLSVPQYDALGQLIQKNVGGVVGGSPLQRVDYRYNIRGWMTQINDVNILNDDLFAFKINYNVRDHHESTLLYNGNISATYWRTQTDNTKRHYNYYYDALNRLNDAHYGKNDQITHNYNESLNYDKNGNITHLVRYGINDYGDPIPIDDIFYNYKNNNVSNQLMRVTETPYGNAAQGFKDGTNTGDDYMYDAFGNMYKDQNKGITNITYNHLNLPKRISFAGNNSITYIYNALGVKLRKEVVEADTQATTHYMGSFQYNNNTLQYIHTAEGYVRHTPPSTSVDGSSYGAFDYVYNYTDHLGNIRLSYTLDPSDQVLKILEENHYYPFGMKHTYNLFRKDIRTDDNLELNPNATLDPSQDPRRVRMVSNTGYQYKYNRKEWQDELGLAMYDYGARNYDPAIGRWMNIDPLAEEALNWTPFRFGFNNPLRFNDPTGMIENDWIPNVEENGSVSYIAEKGDSAKSLSSQYGITQEKAEAITGTKGSEEINKGTKISGEKVKQVTGSEVLKLDLDSKEGQSEQRRFDHFMFASDHSKTQGSWGFFTTDYFSNTQYKSTIEGSAIFKAGGESFSINYRIPFYRSATFDRSGTGIFISNTVFDLKNTDGKIFPNNQANIKSTINHPKTAKQIGTFEFYVHRRDAYKAYDRFNKEFPRYNTIRFPQKID